MTLISDTRTNAVHYTGDFRVQAIQEREIAVTGINLEAWHPGSDCMLVEGRGME
jgi:hypothetical protein